MYAKVNNQTVEQYPFSLHTLRLENPNTSFPDNLEVDHASLAEYGVYRVFPTQRPEFNDRTQKVVELAPQHNGEQWVQSWDVVDLSESELAAIAASQAAAVRAERNRRLTETDWTQVADAPVDQQAWAGYRQALRDITAQAGFPFDIEWPVAPN